MTVNASSCVFNMYLCWFNETQNTQEIKHPNLHTISFVAMSKEHVCTLISQKPQTSQDFVEMFARSVQQDACEKILIESGR